MIRPVTPSDSPALVALSSSSGLFKPDELGAIQEMLDEYHANGACNGHQILTDDDGGTLVGIVYFAPRVFTDRVWELLMIAVDASRHRQGIGIEDAAGGRGCSSVIERTIAVDRDERPSEL